LSALPRTPAEAKERETRGTFEQAARRFAEYGKANLWSPYSTTPDVYRKLAADRRIAWFTRPQLTDEAIDLYVAGLTEATDRARKETRGQLKAIREHWDGIERKRTVNSNHHKAIPWKDAPELYEALSYNDGREARALQFLMLSALRVGEVLRTPKKPGATWGIVQGDELHIPPDLMKAQRLHILPLTPKMMELLGPRKNEPDALLFDVNSQATYDLLKGFRSDATRHGFRTTFRSWCSEKGDIPNDVAERCIAHVEGTKSQQAYKRNPVSERTLMPDHIRNAFEKWNDYVTGLNRRQP
jgi:integrase